MTQKERMLKGMLYDANDQKILDEQFPYMDLLPKFNNLPSSAIKEREQIGVKFYGKVF